MMETAVRIRFETTIEDIVAFNRFHYENSAVWRRQRLLFSLLLPVIFVIAIEMAFLAKIDEFADDPLLLSVAGQGSLLLCALVGVSGFYFMRARMSASVVANVRKLLAEGSNRSITGWREMELTNNRLVVRMELIDTSYDLRAIERIVSDEKYTFVYVSSIQAFMIPMTLYPEEEYRQFVAELLDAWEDRDVPRPIERSADERIVEGPV
jgi:hypothetical protein